MSLRLPAIAFAVTILLAGTGFLFNPQAAPGPALTAAPKPSTVVSRREYLARIVAETAAQVAAETARSQSTGTASPPPQEPTRIARSDTP